MRNREYGWVYTLIYNTSNTRSILNNAYANYDRTNVEEQYHLIKVKEKFSENKLILCTYLKKLEKIKAVDLLDGRI